MRLHLFGPIVTATAAFGCEMWGVHPAEQQRGQLARQHRRYMRRICRLPGTVSIEALMAELGRADIEARWLAHSQRFCNALCAQGSGGLHFELLMAAQWEAQLVGTRKWV